MLKARGAVLCFLPADHMLY